MLSRRELLAASAASVLPAGFPALAADDPDPTRVFTGDRKPTDVRLGPPKTLNDSFPFFVPKTKEAWEARRTQLREQLLVATGLWPTPEKTPLNAVVHGKIERDGYTIEKVFFASTPGHYVTGNLYRPANPDRKGGGDAKRPGVLFAHGHWANGRFHDAGEKAAEASVKAGGEPDLDRGRWFMQAVPATLAKLGFVVFQYDMIGYADSTAIPHREGFKDAAAELRLQSQMGLQTWNSVRALDFLAGLPDVDPKRLGMTGASGGGTQTFMLAAIDDRLAAAFPAVMVSTGMQGGCVCENCSLLRVNTGNVEIAGLFAPKPMAFSAADDWTKEFLTKGYPELERLYKLYGADEKVDAKAWLEYKHQYNVHAREFMYYWFRRHLLFGPAEKVKEPAFQPTPPKELSVYDAEHPRPKDELGAEQLREAMAKASDAQVEKLTPKDAASLKEFRRVIGTALRAMVNGEEPVPRPRRFTSYTNGAIIDMPGGAKGIKGVFAMLPPGTGPDNRLPDPPEQIPVLTAWSPKGEAEEAPSVVWLHPRGKASLVEKGDWVPAAKKLLGAGFRVCAPDLFRTGEQVTDKPFPVDPKFAGFTYGYNRSVLANRVADALLTVSYARHEKIHVRLVGWGEMGVVAVLAKALAGDAVAKTAADLNQFRFENLKDAADPMMLPGAVKYGGLPAFLALCAPGELLAHNHKGTGTGRLAKAAYDAAGAADKLTRSEAKLDDLKVVEWLIK
jgi:dienelactone hydrolase